MAVIRHPDPADFSGFVSITDVIPDVIL